MTVTMDETAIRRAWRAGGGGPFLLELRTRSRRAGEVFSDLLVELNAAHADEGILTQLWVSVPTGYVVQVESVTGDEELSAWLGLLATRLTAAGVTGRLRATSTARRPRWVLGLLAPVTTAVVSWSVDHLPADANPTACGWLPGPERTARITDATTAWTLAGGPRVLVERDAFTFAVDDPAAVADLTRASLRMGSLAGILAHDDDAPRAHSTTFGGATLSTHQVLDAGADWRTRVDAFRRLITALPRDIDQAALRPTSAMGGDWSSVAFRQPLPTGLDEGWIRYNPHVLRRHVYDAHGLQVVREEHLALARDLSGWLVSELGHGRYLVEAPDLAPWYAADLPDPAVVERARADFGPMVVTPDVIRASRPPYPRPTTYDR